MRDYLRPLNFYRTMISLLNTMLFAGVSLAFTIIPPTKGPYGVSLMDLQFTDASRNDTFTGLPGRRIPISLMIPTGPAAECNRTVQIYMPNATARYWEAAFKSQYNISLNNTISQTALSLCQAKPANHSWPLVLLSPGAGVSRQLYNILGSNIAAQGFAVASVDAPNELAFITYPDGSVESRSANETINSDGTGTDAQVSVALDIRVQDFNFVIASLAAELKIVDSSAVAVVGHSEGGGAAAAALLQSNRYIGGVDLDGGLRGAAFNKTLNQPFMIFRRDYASSLKQNASFQPDWAPDWPKMVGPKWEIELVGAEHGTFTDLITLGKTFGLYNFTGVTSILGTINPTQALSDQASVIGAFLGYVFGQKSIENVVGVAQTLSNVTVVNATNLG